MTESNRGGVMWQRVFAIVGFISLALAGTALAQTQGAVAGRVVDSSRAVIPGVTLSLSRPNLVGGTKTSVSNDAVASRCVSLPSSV